MLGYLAPMLTEKTKPLVDVEPPIKHVSSRKHKKMTKKERAEVEQHQKTLKRMGREVVEVRLRTDGINILNIYIPHTFLQLFNNR